MALKKLFTIAEDQIKSGISLSSHFSKSGLWFKARGIYPFVDPFPEGVNGGLLQTSGAPVDISSSVVVDIILAHVSRVTAANTGHMYMIGSNGHFYDKDLSNDNAPTDLRSGTPITNPANGIITFKPFGGTELLYYWQKTQIGTWDISGTYPTGWTDNAYTSLQSTDYHRPHMFGGKIYYTNLDRIGRLSDNGSGGVTHNSNVLSFPSDFVSTCLNDDGNYLVIGITKNKGDNLLRAETRILFWDGNTTTTWNKEWVIPDYNIISIVRFGNGFLAVCGRGLYYFDFNTRPQKIRIISSVHAPGYGKAQAADTFGDAILLGGGIGNISTFGKLIEEDKTVFRVPFAGDASYDISWVAPNVKVNRLYFANTNSKFYYIILSDKGSTSITPETVYIPLGAKYSIKRLDFALGDDLASGDVCGVSLKKDETSSDVAFPNISFTNHGALPDPKTIKLMATQSIITDQVKLKFNFSAGNVKIKSITAYGELHNQQ